MKSEETDINFLSIYNGEKYLEFGKYESKGILVAHILKRA
ncbi:hypothetical protein BGS_0368 [Beggiatoa sp. SS]|nr:hypothetical protein BGS_0368 [Beggiatoa sp. SS]